MHANLWHVCVQCSVQEEGIIVKAANSPWRCNDRGNSWLKIKPDYLQVGSAVSPELSLGKRKLPHAMQRRMS